MSYHNLQSAKFLVCKDFLDPGEASELSEAFKLYCEVTRAQGDSQVSTSKSVYNYMVFKELLYEKVHYLNALLDIKVFPTYSYARVYNKGSVLLPHRDRDACEISVTLNLSKDADWPIYFGEPGESETPIELFPGEAAVYLGRDITHWRNEYQGEEQVQVFLHYVNSRGPFAQCENDRG